MDHARELHVVDLFLPPPPLLSPPSSSLRFSFFEGRDAFRDGFREAVADEDIARVRVVKVEVVQEVADDLLKDVKGRPSSGSEFRYEFCESALRRRKGGMKKMSKENGQSIPLPLTCIARISSSVRERWR